MFGSEFAKQFGLPGPPWETIDNYGGFFGPIAPEQTLPGSDLLGEKSPQAASSNPLTGTMAGATAKAGIAGVPDIQPANPPVKGAQGVQQPGQPDGLPKAGPLGGYGPFNSPAMQPGQHQPGMISPLSLGALAPGGTSGLNSEFQKA